MYTQEYKIIPKKNLVVHDVYLYFLNIEVLRRNPNNIVASYISKHAFPLVLSNRYINIVKK